MRIATNTFIGEVPRLAAELLPDNAAQVAENCRFLSGNLEAWNDLMERPGIVKTGRINSAYLMSGQYWLHWRDEELDYDIGAVDVARGPLEGDTTEFTIFTGTDGPRWTNVNLATDEPPPPGVAVGEYPYISYRLGVPAPDTAPTLTVTQGDSTSDVDVTNGGAEDGGGSITGWTVDTGDLDTHDDNDVPGLTAQSGGFYFYGGAAAAATEAHQDIVLATAGVAPGDTLTLTWYQASGNNGSTAYMSMEFYDSGDALISTKAAPDVAITPALTWEQRTLTELIPETTEYVRLVMNFNRVGVGENDAYIDTITLDAADATFSYDGSSLTGWTNSGWSSAAFGRPSPSFFSGTNDGTVNYIYRLIGSQDSPRIEFQCDIYKIEQEFRAKLAFLLFATQSGQGAGIELDREGGTVTAVNYGSWTTPTGSAIATISSGSQERFKNKWLRLSIVAEKVGTSATLTINLYALDTATVYVSNATVDVPIDGNYFGMRFAAGDTANSAYVDNVAITVDADSVSETDDDVVLTNYVYTLVNGIGQEGAPSPVSRDVQFGDSTTVTVVTPTTADADYNVETKRIYRAVTGTDGTTVYRLVIELPLATASYDDDVQDDGLEDDILLTVDWDVPPFDSQNVVSLPNGITLLTSKNIVCPSVVNYPHAYPQIYRLLTESEIVAVGTIDTSVVLATETRPYMLLGSNPESMSMSKFEQPQGCVSKRSLASIRNYGIIYASPDGLVGISGAGNLQLLTEGYFTRREWQALAPASIIGVAHDDRYFGSCNGQDSTGRGFIFDPRQGGNGWTWLDFDWQAAYSDPETDTLYFVIDNNIVEWEGSDALRPYTWRSKLHLLERPASFRMAQVEAADYDNITLKLYSKGVLYQTKQVTSDREFVIAAKALRDFEYELSGTSRIRGVQFAESVGELS